MVTLLLRYTSRLAYKFSVSVQNSHPAVIHPSSEMRTGHFKVAKKERGNPVTTSSCAFGESTVHYFLMLFRILYCVIRCFVDKYLSVYPPLVVSFKYQLFFWQLSKCIFRSYLRRDLLPGPGVYDTTWL